MSIQKCNKCNDGMMIKKFNRSSGKAFLACSNYPKCKNAMPFIYVKEESIINDSISHIVLTFQQEKIYNEFIKFENSILVDAGPGTGKSTILQYIYIKSLKDSGKNIIALTFSKLSANALKEKGINIVKTVHAESLSIAKKVYPKTKLKVNEKGSPVKIQDIILSCGIIAEDERKKYVKPVNSIITMLDAHLLPCNEESIKWMVNEGFKLELELNTALIDILLYVEKTRKETRESFIDYDECIKIAIENPDYVNKYDVILLDESQDTSKLNQSAIKLMLNEGGIILAVGDVNQSIYTFRGADKNSMNNIAESFNATRLPMDITRRCPKNIVNGYINKHFPNITLTSVKEGGELIENLPESFMMESLINDKNAFIICRNNAPLVKPAYAMIKLGYSACILGLDIKENLINLLLKNKGYDLYSTLENLKKYVNDLFVRFEKAKDKQWILNIQDEEDTIKSIAEGCDSLDEVMLKIDSLFSNKQADYTFLTGHKSKGLEHNNIYLYRLDLIGNKKDMTESESEQENHLHFVMASRSLNKMVTIKSDI